LLLRFLRCLLLLVVLDVHDVASGTARSVTACSRSRGIGVVTVEINFDDVDVFFLFVARSSLDDRCFHSFVVFLALLLLFVVVVHLFVLDLDPRPRGLSLPTPALLVRDLSRPRLLLFLFLSLGAALLPLPLLPSLVPGRLEFVFAAPVGESRPAVLAAEPLTLRFEAFGVLGRQSGVDGTIDDIDILLLPVA
jgi:hypothetical protein